jgi:hypothetical protein
MNSYANVRYRPRSMLRRRHDIEQSINVYRPIKYSSNTKTLLQYFSGHAGAGLLAGRRPKQAEELLHVLTTTLGPDNSGKAADNSY